LEIGAGAAIFNPLKKYRIKCRYQEIMDAFEE
jgi:hypothetical protein